MKINRLCEQVQTSLSLRSASSVEALDPAIEAHLHSCEACSEFRAGLARLELEISTWRSAPPHPDLEQRIAASLIPLASSSRSRSSLLWLRGKLYMNRRFAIGTAALLAIAAMATSHRTVQANTALHRMGDAARHMKDIHLIGWTCELTPEVAEQVENGNTQISIVDTMPHRYEAWIQNGSWRQSQDFNSILYKNGKVWNNGEPDPLSTEPPFLLLSAFRAINGAEPFGKQTPFTCQDLGEDRIYGNISIKIQVESKKPDSDVPAPTQERRLYWVDPSTYLPLRMEEWRFQHDRWELDAVLWFDYNTPAPQRLFDPEQIKLERHGTADNTKLAADQYRLTASQQDRYARIVAEYVKRQTITQTDKSMTKEARDSALVALGSELKLQLRGIMTADQQHLFDDWWYVEPKTLEKLATPEQRQEDARWLKQQRLQMHAWLNTLDKDTRRWIEAAP